MFRTIAILALALALGDAPARAVQIAEEEIDAAGRGGGKARKPFPTRRQKAARDVVRRGVRLADAIAGQRGGARTATAMVVVGVTAAVARRVEGNPGPGLMRVVDHGIDSNFELHDPNVVRPPTRHRGARP